MATQLNAPQSAPEGTMTTERTHPVPLRSYHAAVQQHFGWRASDYELLEEWSNGPVLVKHGPDVFRVDHPHDLEGEAVLLLTSQDHARHMPTAWANQLFTDAPFRPEFYPYFLQQFDGVSTQASGEIQLMLALYQTVTKRAKTFWETIQELDKAKLYPQALLAAAQLSDFETLADKLVGLLTAEGDALLNELRNGVFERIRLTEGNGMESNTFYSYPVKPSRWAQVVAANSQRRSGADN
ncbi:hypothetical protein Q5H92_19895 [Hymenobacter sp. M29]|uniref:Uncharacterized protein n=1 Tax=Hymenobacter mellowenesis TaxID=3063995 RepID=A0ABT9AFK4_9BACT|nr:hypothetical protein [Hymenobacter sp. M29]MDO7848639.1 hypothetical protein [Hymenobacter sp. M29]